MVAPYGAVPIVGTANDLHPDSYDLYWGIGLDPPSYVSFGSGTNDIVSGSLGEMPEDDPDSPTYPNGPVTLRLDTVDVAGNATTITHQISFDRLQILNLVLSPEVFDPYASESASISYEISHDVDVTLKLHASGGPSVTRTLLAAVPRTAGIHVELWDGSTDVASIAGNGGYFASISASDAQGRFREFNPPDDPAMGSVPAWVGSSVRFNGEALLANADIDVHQNEELRIDYDMNGPGWHTLRIEPTGTGAPPEFDLRSMMRLPTGPTHEIWDGRLDTGELYSGTFTVFFDFPRAIEEHIVFVQTPLLRVDGFSVNPYVFRPMYAEVSNIRFDLARDALVQIDIIDPNGNFLRTLQTSAPFAAGEHLLLWDGTDDNGEVVDVEGLYEVQVTAQDSLTGDDTIRRGAVTVIY